MDGRRLHIFQKTTANARFRRVLSFTNIFVEVKAQELRSSLVGKNAKRKKVIAESEIIL